MPKKILYYTQVYFLDNALEYVKLLTDNLHELHVLIDLSPNQLQANILHLEVNLEGYEGLTPLDQICDSWKLGYLMPYLKACKSVNFAVYPSKKIAPTLKVSQQIRKHIQIIAPDYIHLDEVSNRHLFLLPYLMGQRKRIILNIHDPKLHSGEADLIRYWSRKLLFRYIPSFVVFSEHSKNLLATQLMRHKKITSLKLLPYTVYSKFLKNETPSDEKKYVSFVGRISPYKGVELFANAINLVHARFPEQQFIIAGKTITDYNPEFLTVPQKNLEIRNRFLTNEEMSEIIGQSKLIVCPYIDATQSGVIMTAYALKCPVLVTNTGGLPEYVTHEKTGIIVDGTSPEAISDGICQLLAKDYFSHLQNELKSIEFAQRFQIANQKKLDALYK